MDFELPPEAEAYRAGVRAFLAEHAPDGRYPADFDPATGRARATSLRTGPRPGAAGPRRSSSSSSTRSCARPRTPRPMNPIGIGWAGPTLLVAGTRRQQQRYLPGLLDGSELWCQLFTEPGAGSDLAWL